ncbi:MAG: peptidase M61 [Novosphingobium sp.]
MKTIIAAACLLSAITIVAPAPASASAQQGLSAPQAVVTPARVPDAADRPYPGGPITLDIDATDVTRSVFRVTERIPVAPGTRTLTLLLPEWLPGEHKVAGGIDKLADLRFTVDGRPLAWERDPVEVYAFHLTLPEGARMVETRFIHTAPLVPAEGRVTMTPEMLNLQWDKMSLYPAGHYVRQIRVQPSVTFPAGWTVFTALDGQSAANAGGKVRWAEVAYDTLVDSPVFAGAYARKWDLGRGVSLDVVADQPAMLDLSPANAARFRAMVDEAVATFGSRHFDHYDFLLAVSDKLGDIGLEHHRSSENTFETEALTKWEAFDWSRNVVPHEFAHSWDGKFRRPARLWTPDYRQPMQGNLLWVYEGQNQFWGLVLAARSGVQSKQTVLDMLASYLANYTYQAGRDWRSIEDTTLDPVMAARRPKPYASLARTEDYYQEGALVWLEADQIIRSGTAGRRGLDDFARGFFGMRDGDWGELTYEFGDVVAALNAVYPYDWATFLDTRFNRPGQPVPSAGIERAGYRLVWRDQPNGYDAGRAAKAKSTSFAYSLGLTVGRENIVTAALWGSPAFNAGVVSGAKLVAVNGLAYDADGLRDAITAAKSGKQPLELLIQRGDRFQTVPIDYHGGLRYPWLERIAPGGPPAGLDLLLAPRTASARK